MTSGELILTPVDGRSESYVAGDTLLVPKGWKGTWEMRGNYREFVVIETRANDSLDGFWKNIGLIIAGWFRDTPHVVPLPAEEFRRAELEPVQPTAADLKMTGGDPEAWKAVGTKRLYEGEFIVELYASPAAVVQIDDPFPYDELVWMLSGELVLTPKGGEAVTYGAGEGVVVPKGFVGTWETRGDYRELIIIETRARFLFFGDREGLLPPRPEPAYGAVTQVRSRWPMPWRGAARSPAPTRGSTTNSTWSSSEAVSVAWRLPISTASRQGPTRRFSSS